MPPLKHLPGDVSGGGGVQPAREAIGIAKEHGLTWFDLEEWNATREAWETLGAWATDDAGNWVSIPASER